MGCELKRSTHLVHLFAGLSPASHPLSSFVVTYNAQKIGSSFSPAPGGGEQGQQARLSANHSGHAPGARKWHQQLGFLQLLSPPISVTTCEKPAHKVADFITAFSLPFVIVPCLYFFSFLSSCFPLDGFSLPSRDPPLCSHGTCIS